MIEILTNDEEPWKSDYVEYGIHGEVERIIPCDCTEHCPRPCKGECGCKACQMHYSDFLSWDHE